MKYKISSNKFIWGGLCMIIAGAILVSAMFIVSDKKPIQAKVLLGGAEILVTVADTPSTRARGLSGHDKLEPNDGMLFVFPESKLHGFWMKDMQFPIDIIWFDANHRVVDVSERADPESYPKVFNPRVPAQFVLEVPAGFFSDHHIKLGNILEIPR